VPPKGININHGEPCIFFMGRFDLHRVATIMDQIMRIEEVLPVLAPPLCAFYVPLRPDYGIQREEAKVRILRGPPIDIQDIPRF
jgi:hypothetical protein